MNIANRLRRSLRRTANPPVDPSTPATPGAASLLAPIETASDANRFKGVIDRFDPRVGLLGWCADLERPDIAVELELLVDDLVVARSSTSTPRPDVQKRLELDGDFGFCFATDLFERFAVHQRFVGERKVAVRIANTSLKLIQNDSALKLSEILEARAGITEKDETQALFDRLGELQQDAALFLAAPFRGDQAGLVGYVETVATGSNGVIWFIGWAGRTFECAFATVILDRQKFRGGAIVASFEREDLDAGSVGIVGVLRTDWRPNSAREAVFVIDEEGDRHLRSTRNLRNADTKEIFAHIQRALGAEDASTAQQLLAFLQANEAWTFESPAQSHVRVAIDSAAALEGFGAFVKGWIYSPARSVKRLFLKIGERVLESDPETLTFTSRPDLLSAFPSGREAIGRAGFCCIFEAEGRALSQSDLKLKIVYDDGSASYHGLPDVVVHAIAPDDDGGRFKEFFPHLERQRQFSAYARAYYARCEAHYGQCRFDALEPAPIQMVFAVPSDRHSLYLIFEELRENMRKCAAEGVGVVIVAAEAARHGDIRELFHTLCADYSGPCSLAFVPDIQASLWALDSALLALGARRFVHVGAGVVLNGNGWKTISDWLASSPDPLYLEVEDPCEPWSDAKPTLQAFGWSTEAFLAWRVGHRLPVGSASFAPASANRSSCRPECGSLIARTTPSLTLTRINRLVDALQDIAP